MRDKNKEGEDLKEVGRRALSVTGVGSTALVSPAPGACTVEKERTHRRAFRRGGEGKKTVLQQEVRREQGTKANT